MEFEQILQLIDAVSESELASFQMEKDGIRLSMTTDKMPSCVLEQNTGEEKAVLPEKTALPEAPGEEKGKEPQKKAEKEQTEDTGFKSDKIVKAPLVGIFYAAPSEDASPFVKVGDTVKKGQIIGIIEAMKLMNEIESEYDGVVEAVMIENEQVVEYGQPLFRIR